jgi:thymidylate synthase (FAD)
VDDEPECWIPEVLRARDANKKQGSKDEPIPNNDGVLAHVKAHTNGVMEFYNFLLKEGVAPEIARSVLPQSMYTEFVETGSLSAYARLCSLRLDPQAQKEIREYATAVSELMAAKFPVSWKALQPTHSTSESS